MNVQSIVENRLKSYEETGKALSEDWKDLLDGINEGRVKKGQEVLSDMDRRNLSICFENASMDTMLKAQGGMLNETTDSSAISFLGTQLPLISSILPSLILNDLCTVQALERRSAAIFYMDVVTGTAKDGIAAASTLLSAKTGHSRTAQSRAYGSQTSTVNVGSANAGSLVATLANRPIVAGTLTVTDGIEVFVDNGAGALVSSRSGAVNGAVAYDTGVISLTWTYHLASKQPVATYAYKYENATAPTSGIIVPDINLTMTSKTVTAVDFMLQTKFTMAALMDLKKAHGMDLEAEVTRVIGGELAFSQDRYGIDKMYQAAWDRDNGAGSATTFNATVGSGQEFVWRKFQFNDAMEEASNLIFAKTLRGMGSWIICGNNVARLVKQLKPDFVPVAGLGTKTPTGAYKIGTLNGRAVYQDPFFPTNEYIMGYKGDSFLQSAAVFSPYIPLFVSPTLTTSDLNNQKGFMASAAFTVVNAGLFSNGSISGL